MSCPNAQKLGVPIFGGTGKGGTQDGSPYGNPHLVFPPSGTAYIGSPFGPYLVALPYALRPTTVHERQGDFSWKTYPMSGKSPWTTVTGLNCGLVFQWCVTTGGAHVANWAFLATFAYGSAASGALASAPNRISPNSPSTYYISFSGATDIWIDFDQPSVTDSAQAAAQAAIAAGRDAYPLCSIVAAVPSGGGGSSSSSIVTPPTPATMIQTFGLIQTADGRLFSEISTDTTQAQVDQSVIGYQTLFIPSPATKEEMEGR